MTDRLSDIADGLVHAAREAGSIVRDRFRSVGMAVATKSSCADLVTEVDVAAQERIIDLLSSRFPGIGIVGEEREDGRRPSEAFYVDPIDGTLNYAHGLGPCAVSIGYWIGGQPMAGVVYNPLQEDLFLGIRGRGASRNGKRIVVSSASSLNQCLLATGWPYAKEDHPRVLRALAPVLAMAQEVRVLGSASLALCYVADGVLDGFWEWGLMPWDMAAGAVVALEAGAMITAPDGGLFHLEGGAVAVTNGRVHDALLKCLRLNGR
jgi:myo-inositol-1(or 4)-monophosphatase